MCCRPATGEEECCMPHMRWGHAHGLHMQGGFAHRRRHFLTKEERIEMLEKYKEELEKEIRGVEQRLQEMRE